MCFYFDDVCDCKLLWVRIIMNKNNGIARLQCDSFKVEEFQWNGVIDWLHILLNYWRIIISTLLKKIWRKFWRFSKFSWTMFFIFFLELLFRNKSKMETWHVISAKTYRSFTCGSSFPTLQQSCNILSSPILCCNVKEC